MKGEHHRFSRSHPGIAAWLTASLGLLCLVSFQHETAFTKAQEVYTQGLGFHCLGSASGGSMMDRI
jgi:hypothetical protein